MDKYNSKTSFQEWVSSINLNELPEETKNILATFDHYSKKLDFQTTLKLMLHAVYEEIPSFREIDRAFMDPRLCKELGLNSLCHSSLSRKLPTINSKILMEIFGQLVHKISAQRPSSKTSSLQLIDSITIPLNKTWFPWTKFRKTKSGIKLHLNLCYLDASRQSFISFAL